MMWLIKFFTQGGISAIGEQINRGIEIREKAKTDKARLEADQNIAGLQAARDVEVERLVARAQEKPGRAITIARIILTIPAFFILLKMAADYMGTGEIDDVPGQLWAYVGLALSFYFWGKPFGDGNK